MKRRDLVYGSFATASGVLLSRTVAYAKPSNCKTIDAKGFHASRRFADLPLSRVAFVERGHGPAALFVHGYPLNGFQWRGALQRIQAYRRCIAPDVMGMGYTQTPKGQKISPEIQATMLAMLLDSLHINAVIWLPMTAAGSSPSCFSQDIPVASEPCF
jgi:haloalkane dehalogenase